jgi:hypothetical protein
VPSDFAHNPAAGQGKQLNQGDLSKPAEEGIQMRSLNAQTDGLEDQLLRAQQELRRCSIDLLSDLERRKGKMSVEAYIEFRRFLNCVNDTLVHAAEATTTNRWLTAKEEIIKADSVLTDIQKALQMNISLSQVMNR